MARKKTGVTANRQRDEKGRLLPAAEQAKPPVEPQPVAAPQPAVAPPMPEPQPPLFEAPMPGDGLYPNPIVWRQLHEIGQTILESGMKPDWIHTIQQMVTVLLRGYELRVGPHQILWNTYRGDDGRLLNTAELMRSLVLRSGVGQLEVVRRDNEEVTYKATRGSTQITATWKISDLAGPIKGLPRQTLDARCISEICRTLFADIAGGYTPEDFDRPSQPQAVPPTPPAPPPPPAEPEKPKAAPPAPAPAPEAPVKAPEPPPEPPAAAAKAPEPPPAAPPPQAAPAAPAPPGYNEEVQPGRRLTRLVQAPLPDGRKQPVYTAGITADQIARIYQTAGQQHQAAAQRWLQYHKLQRLSWVTEEEAQDMIRFLTGVASGGNIEELLVLGADPKNPVPELTRDRALHIFAREMQAIGLDVDQALRYIAQKAGQPTHQHLQPEQIVQAAEDFKALAAADLNSFKLAFARETDRMGIDPSGGSAPF
jgi:hypothetical protein